MNDYKIEAAKECLQFLEPGKTIGLGAGTTITHLVNLIVEKLDLATSLKFVTSSFKTRSHLQEKGLNIQFSATMRELDIYFDGCDQFDQELNALKSGGGIHTSEKILASMAKEFILSGDDTKFVPKLDNTYPLTVEILPEALNIVLYRLRSDYSNAIIQMRLSNQKDGAVISENGNMLADIKFSSLPDLAELNLNLKMIPGIVDHSLFYRMATKAIVAGKKGTQIIVPIKNNNAKN